MGQQKPVMKIGIVGCGIISYYHGDAVNKMHNAYMTACADVYPDKARKFAEKYGIEGVYDSLEAMLAKEEMDLLIIATWPADHYQHIKTACRMGVKAILCEKPLCLSGQEADEILAITRENSVLMMEGVMYRHQKQIQRAKKMVDSGEIGDIRYIQGIFTFNPEGADNHRLVKKAGGGSMRDQASYMVNAINYFLGSAPYKVYNAAGFQEDGLDISNTATLFYEGNIMAHLASRFHCSWREKIEIVGSKMSLLIPRALVNFGFHRDIVIIRDGCSEHETYRTIHFDAEDAYQKQLENCYNVLFAGEMPGVPIQESVKNMHVIDALLESGRKGIPVEIANKEVQG